MTHERRADLAAATGLASGGSSWPEPQTRAETLAVPDAPQPRVGGSGAALRHSRAAAELLFGPPATRRFDVRYWEGTVERAPDPAFTFVIGSPAALRGMLLPPSELSIIESFLSHDIDIEGGLERAVILGDTINQRLASPTVLARLLRHLMALPRRRPDAALHRARASRRVAPAGRKHELPRDREAIRYHYDVGNDFYALWLDSRMVYTCAYFPTGNETLEEAQIAKLDLVCRKLHLRPGESLLDVGCGWGALVMHAVSNYGVRALGITLSEAQAALANQRIREAGLADRCRVDVRDYRELPDGTFDKIAAVGVVEHVGAKNLPKYFESMFHALSPGGLLLNHGMASITAARPQSFLDRVGGRLWRRNAFVEQYVFPDGKLGAFDAVIGAAESVGFETRDVESLREHYTKTLRLWVRNLEQRGPEAIALTDERTYRTWKLYLSASARFFDTGTLNVLQTLFSKPDADRKTRLPLARMV